MPTKKSKSSASRRSRSAARARSPRWLGWAIFVGLLVIAILAIYFQNRSAPLANTLPNESSPAQAYALISQGAIVIDIRQSGWFAQYRIPGSLNVPKDEVSRNLAMIPKGVNLVVIDDLGDQSAEVRDYLLRRGYPSVTIVIGGITGWIEQGLFVEGTFPY